MYGISAPGALSLKPLPKPIRQLLRTRHFVRCVLGVWIGVASGGMEFVPIGFEEVFVVGPG